ncbi:MAG: hypothetical protein NTW21_41585 [Verrucomicrobia bacterium]|nr:hypothetical protein [Verrucomicrobiota bacterium]
MPLPTLSKIISLKPEPQTTPTLNQIIQQGEARQTVANYLFTPSLRSNAKKIFECVVHGKGQGFWVQAEYGAGKTSLLGAILCLLMWGEEENVWDALTDQDLRDEYRHAIEKRKLFPIAFSVKGLGDSRGAQHDSLMRIFEEQIEESIRTLRPDLVSTIRFTSADLAIDWFDNDAQSHWKKGVELFIKEQHQMSAADYRKAHGEKKLGQVIVDSGMVGTNLKSKFKERFSHICQQITKLGGYDGVIFVVDEFRSWQDRHAQHSAVAAEDEDVLETLAHVLPGDGINVITIIASQGDIPQKLSGGGKSDRFIPLILLGDKSKSDFGEIVAFRTVEHLKGAATGINDYCEQCRKEYRFLKQSKISDVTFSAIFPFQPRVFEILRRITQSAEQNSLPTARSAIRMAWQAIKDGNLLTERRMVVVSDLIRSDEMRKGLTSDFYKEKYQSLQAAIEQLAELDFAQEEQDQAQRILETLFLQAISLPDNLRDGLTEQEIAEAAWLADDAVGSAGQANHLLEILVSGGMPVRREKKPRSGTEVTVYSYETSALELKPASVFGPLKKKFKDDTAMQDAKWQESLFWDISAIDKEIQAELQLNGGILHEFQPDDQRTAEDVKNGVPARLSLPKTISVTTKRVHNIAYSGEAVAGTAWRDEWGKTIVQSDIHFRVVFLTSDGAAKDQAIQSSIQDPRIAVCRIKPLGTETREALADLLAAEKMRRDNASSPGLRAYADEKRAEAIKTVLRRQLLEYKGCKVLTQADYGIQPINVFAQPSNKTEEIARALLGKAYDKPLFIPTEIKKPLSDTEARKVYAALFGKEPQKADRDAATNFAPGLELSKKNAPQELRADDSTALKRIRDLMKGKTDVPVKDLRSALCTPPYGLTDWMVQLYVFALLKHGGWELALNPASSVQTHDGKPLPGNKLNAHTLAIVDWNAKLDKALLGARLIASTRKGWNEVLPFARVLDSSLKTATSPDEEQERNTEFVRILATLGAEIPQVRNTLNQVAPVLDGTLGQPFKEILSRLDAIAAAVDFHEFDATVRVSYDTDAKFATAFEDYKNALQVRNAAVDLTGAATYMRGACKMDSAIELDRTGLLALIRFDTLLASPHLIAARLDAFKQWKGRYTQAYRKAHRSHHETLESIGKQVASLAPQARGLARLNTLVELGPPTPGSTGIEADLANLNKAVWICPDAAGAAVDADKAVCPKCAWTPESALPDKRLGSFQTRVAEGIDDRMRRFKDAAITTILQQAAGGKPEIKTLLDVITAANADKLVNVLTEGLVDFIRKLLQEQNLAQVEVSIADILNEVGAIEGERIDEAVDAFSTRLRKKLKDAKANQAAGKRVRLFLQSGPNSSCT